MWWIVLLAIGCSGTGGDSSDLWGFAPTVEILEPTEDAALFSDVDAVLRGTATSSEVAADALLVAWISDLQGTLGSDLAVEGGEVTQTVRLEVGTHQLSMVATDPAGRTGTDVVEVVVHETNQPPSTPTISLTPPAPKTTEDLHVSVDTDAVDPEGATVTYAIEWFLDDVLQSIDGDTVTASHTTRGQVWRVRVIPSDGLVEGTPAQADETIVNSPPAVPSVDISPATPTASDDLQCVIASSFDADGDDLSFTYRWIVDFDNYDGTTDTVPAADTSSGQTWKCLATPNDGVDGGPAGVAEATVGS